MYMQTAIRNPIFPFSNASDNRGVFSNSKQLNTPLLSNKQKVINNGKKNE